MSYVLARSGESIESLLKRFKKKLKNENFFVDVRKHDFYMKPSDKRKAKRRRSKLTDGREFIER